MATNIVEIIMLNDESLMKGKLVLVEGANTQKMMVFHSLQSTANSSPGGNLSFAGLLYHRDTISSSFLPLVRRHLLFPSDFLWIRFLLLMNVLALNLGDHIYRIIHEFCQAKDLKEPFPCR